MKATSFGVGLILTALASWALLAGEPKSVSELCVNGHPAKRAPNITYGGFPTASGYQRDHRVPLCLGGPDTRENVRWQPIAQAKIKDREEHELCEAMCAGTISQEAAIAKIRKDWP